MQPKTPLNEQIQNDSTLHTLAHTIVNGFGNLYSHLQKLKQKAVDQKQLSQLTHMETKLDTLAEKTLTESQDLRNTMKRSNVQWEIENLRQQLELLQKRHEELEERHEDLEKRVTDLECTMVSRDQFEDLRRNCQERFSLFDNRFKVIQQNNEKFYVCVDEEFKKRIRPSQQFKQKLSQLMKTNYRLFEYAKKMYWSLINQILAYRALSSGMVQKGSMKANFQQTTLFKEVVTVVSSATYLIAGVPLVGGIFLVVKDLTSIFFKKREELVVNNMCLRVEGYFTEDEIAEDVARAVLELINNPHIETRLNQFRTRSMIISALCKFFEFIATAELSPQLLADMFASKLTRMSIKKEKELNNDFLIENVITDTSLVMWKMAECLPAEKRYPLSGAVRVLFSKNLGQGMQGMQGQMGQSAMNQNMGMTGTQVGQNTYVKLSSGPALERNFIMDDENQGNGNVPPIQVTESKTSALSSRSTLPSESQLSQQNPLNNLTNIPQQPQSQSNPQFNPYQNYPPQQRPPYFKLKLLRADISDRKQFFNITRMNIYCIAKYRDRIVRTDPLKTVDLKPVWNQEFIFQTAEMPSAITIQVYDKERLLRDQLIGTATVLDAQIDRREQEVQIWNQGKVTGKVTICLQP